MCCASLHQLQTVHRRVVQTSHCADAPLTSGTVAFRETPQQNSSSDASNFEPVLILTCPQQRYQINRLYLETASHALDTGVSSTHGCILNEGYDLDSVDQRSQVRGQ